ncbi:hypothetical protein [Dactylosporangium sp. NPDC048998]|uniref:hypothetical protein n=1 Tax=Dactylosporangium sp. NPDC048998 TaxID=3363976 RepID=UPI00371163C3
MNDEFEAQALKPLMRPQPMPPSKVDIKRALAEGRRRERSRRLLAVAAVAVAVGATLIGVSAFAPDRRPPQIGDETPPSPTVVRTRNGCGVQRLPTPGGAPAVVGAVDPAGRYAVGTLDGDSGGEQGAGVVLLWTDGVLQPVAGAPLPYPHPAGVNAAGVVVGNSQGESTSVPWMLKDGTFTRLATPPDADTVSAEGINAAGDIIGTASWQDGSRATRARIVRWNVARPEQFAYVTTSPTIARASGVADDGTVFGRGMEPGHDPQPYVWRPDGTPRLLKRSGGKPAYGVTQIAGDWAIGYYEDGSTWFDQGVRWNLRTGEVRELGTFVPGGVDASGRMFGVVMRSIDDAPPALWTDGAVLEMPVLSDGQSAVVTSMSADGRTAVGWLSRSKNDPVLPVRWTC